MTLTANIDALTSPQGRVQEAATIVRDCERRLAEVKGELPRYLREAKQAGATIKDLEDWTGYSRRMIFYMLKEQP